MNNEIIFTREYPYIGKLSAIVTVPSDYKKEEKLPVILFLHGAGERGNDIEKLKVHGIPKLFAKDPDYHGLRVITASPQCPENNIWNQLTIPLMKWIDTVVEKYNGDRKRIAITGISMGGYGTWDVICTYPEYFCCAAPICGGGMTWRTGALNGKKIRVFHGLDDNVVPFSYSLQMVEAARKSGAEIDFFAYDKVGHNSWETAYEHTDLIEWLAAQSL